MSSRLPRHLPAVCLCLLGLAWLPLAARASGTWKCQTADGGVAYVNNHLSDYRHCVRISGGDAVPAAPVARKGAWTYGESRAGEAPPSVMSPAAAVRVADDGKATTPKAGAARVIKGTMYKVMRADGIPEYTNIRPRGKAKVLFHYIATCYACDVHSSTDWSRVSLNTTAFASEVDAAARANGIDASLLRALIHAESAFDPDAVSVKGAQGLTQLMPATARELGVSDAFDPGENIRGGARYLAQLLKDFGGDARLATAAYNAGAGAVHKYGGVPPFAETQVYVDRVGLLYQRYRGALGAATTAASGFLGAK
ncbi:MAG TPA: lytic transglycosylase domain-containing protein [Rhodanobacteraceae bacterium]|nr:lytic transglycosylase domain-containing protein [Rhodanobacteraceae bacterium]